MKVNDALWGLVLLVLGGAVLLAIQGYPKIPGQPVGPALFPGLIAVGLCACGALLMVKGWRARRNGPWLQWEDWVHSPRHVLALAVLLGSVVLYIVAGTALGFLPTAFVILVAMMAVLVIPILALQRTLGEEP